jgi:deoxyribose-phosphate aldolase
MHHGQTELAILRPDSLPADVHKVATDVLQQGYAGIVIAPIYVSRVVTMLRGSGATVTAAVNYPHGTSKPTLKAIEATSCIKDGADAVLLVPHWPNVLRGDFDALRAELLEIARAARSTRRDVQIHVLIERITAEPLIAAACRAVRESACDGIVVSDALEIARKHAESLLVITSNAALESSLADRAIVFTEE